jgi:mRNA-degrading endonuclease RelE of RelBE toxin-antitoxin system
LRIFEVLLSETARRQLTDLPEAVQPRIKQALAELKEDPFRPRPKADLKRLKGTDRDYYRQRIGDFRVIHVVKGQRVLVAKVLPRSKAYRWIE